MLVSGLERMVLVNRDDVGWIEKVCRKNGSEFEFQYQKGRL